MSLPLFFGGVVGEVIILKVTLVYFSHVVHLTSVSLLFYLGTKGGVFPAILELSHKVSLFAFVSVNTLKPFLTRRGEDSRSPDSPLVSNF